jgi:hypothetical protein
MSTPRVVPALACPSNHVPFFNRQPQLRLLLLLVVSSCALDGISSGRERRVMCL